ncbi:hypothetical protein HYU92_04500 [Candidatus Curtissbacteria bacterium]|nr:hypothetical protein [Candidatus Curtissbacteria bacterium]
MSVKHKAQAAAITCIDFRFQQMIEKDLEKRHLEGNCDRISWPGASKDHDKVLEATALSIRLHDPDQVYIYEHEDCGAYQQDNSIETHRQNANKFANSLREIKPSLVVNTLIATFQGISPL